MTRQQQCYLKKRESIATKARRTNIRKKKETEGAIQKNFLEKARDFYSYYSLKNHYVIGFYFYYECLISRYLRMKGK